MNNLSKKYSILFAAVAGFLAVAIFLGCNKQASDAGAPVKSAGGKSEAPIKSAEKTTFDEVTAHLDPGGNMYGYFSTTEALAGLSGRINEWREAVLSLPGVQSADSTNINRAFDFGTHLVKASGIEQISGVGFSGIALEPGYYQTKLFVHRSSPSDGLLWSATGKTAHPFAELDWLPADTACAIFADMDFNAAWGFVRAELDKANVPEIAEGVQKMEQAVKQSTGSELSRLLESLGGEYGLIVTLNPERKIPVPSFSTNQMEIPEPGVIIAIKVKDDTLFNLFDKDLKKQKNVMSIEKNGYRARVMPIPLPLPVALRPTVARYGDYLFLTSNDALLEKIVEVKDGRKPGLKSAAEFLRLAKGMPTQGNQFVYVSEVMGKTFRDVQQAVLNSPLGKTGDNQAATALMRKMFQNSPVSSVYSVGGHTADGWLHVTHGNKNPMTLLAAPVVVAPIAVAAGIMLPALAKGKERAVSINCVNNLKQIGIAARMYANDHNGQLPPDLAALKDELGSPKILFCPADKNAPNLKTLTWENLDIAKISYEFLMPEEKLDAASSTKVLARCRIHGHTCLADGSVQQATKAGK